MAQNELTGSEAVYGFVAWLTTRLEAVTFGASHNCSVAAELVNEFCEANNLEQPREDWTRYLTHPAPAPSGDQEQQ